MKLPFRTSAKGERKDGDHHSSSYPAQDAPSPQAIHNAQHQHAHSAATARLSRDPEENGCLYCIHRLRRPHGVSPRWKRLERIIGRVGFAAKGVVYGFVGGMTCASASKLHEGLENSPQGAFVMIGSAPSGSWALFVMLLSLWCYSIWRFWEFLTYQGRDLTFSKSKNFFRFRLSPLVSGCVYIAYSYYILTMLLNRYKNRSPSCYPNCWRDTTLGTVMLVLMGTAFMIATITQLQNAFTNKWHSEINWNLCKTKVGRYMLLGLGHVGFLGRAGIFLFVGILMFKALKHPVKQSGDTIADGLGQLMDGNDFMVAIMMIVGLCTTAYGLFALLNSRYRHFPTPPPSGQPYMRSNPSLDRPPRGRRGT
ncbi:hypothetical protein HDU87_000712 [Geranomyces variabilis]|uniref:DUF1206 domain-containing protein n=1 Tax=Geranomyces variabilis TaxID=109894 RepID=A0AAD5TT18_9FUNG|nr:hypothetical protein HDU87_000712 [Geranomyces variabilis]